MATENPKLDKPDEQAAPGQDTQGTGGAGASPATKRTQDQDFDQAGRQRDPKHREETSKT